MDERERKAVADDDEIERRLRFGEDLERSRSESADPNSSCLALYRGGRRSLPCEISIGSVSLWTKCKGRSPQGPRWRWSLPDRAGAPIFNRG